MDRQVRNFAPARGVRVTRDELKEIREVATQLRVSDSDAMRLLIAHGLAQLKESNVIPGGE